MKFNTYIAFMKGIKQQQYVWHNSSTTPTWYFCYLYSNYMMTQEQLSSDLLQKIGLNQSNILNVDQSYIKCWPVNKILHIINHFSSVW